MREPTPDLDRAAMLLMAAGSAATLWVGVDALARDAGPTVIAAVLLAILLGIAGWLVVTLGRRALGVAAALAGLGSLAVTVLLGRVAAGWAVPGVAAWLVAPGLVLLLALAVGRIGAGAWLRDAPTVPWSIRGADEASLLLHLAAAPAVWTGAAVVASPLARPGAAGMALALAGAAGVAAVTAGRIVERGGHPRGVLLASAAVLAVEAWFLLALEGAAVAAGRWIALSGMLAVAYPLAFAAVAWVDVKLVEEEDLERTRLLS